MSSYQATVRWDQGDGEFLADDYSRGHVWSFDGGIEVPASASPDIVPLPKSVAAAVDPEEAFVASLASCHMLFFLSLAAKRRIDVVRYRLYEKRRQRTYVDLEGRAAAGSHIRTRYRA